MGVVADFNFESLKNKIQPCYYLYWETRANLLVKVKKGTLQQSVALLDEQFEAKTPDQTFNYELLTNIFEAQHQEEVLLRRALAILTALICFITILGIYGKSSFIYWLRIKEMAIRRVLGSNFLRSFKVFGRQTLLFSVAAYLISIGPSLYFIKDWLLTFQYSAPLSALCVVPEYIKSAVNESQ